MATFDILAAAAGQIDWEPETGPDVDPLEDPTDVLVKWPNVDGTVTHLIGTGFTFDVNGDPTAGTITDIEHRSADEVTLLGQASGLNHSLVTAADAISTSLEAFFAFLFDGDDTITSLDTDNTELGGFDGADTIFGGSGDDTITGGGGADHLDGGGQSLWDVASYAYSPAAVQVYLDTGVATGGEAEGDTFAGIEGIVGSMFGDLLTGNDSSNWLWGGPGNDTLTGGDDLKDVASYRDAPSAVTVRLALGTVTGGHGADVLFGIDNIEGSAYSDTITGDANDNVLWGGPGSDTLNGGAGDDIINFWTMLAPVAVNMATGRAVVAGFGTDMFSNFEGVTGTEFGDTLVGDTVDNHFEGRAGADTINGGSDAEMGDYVVYWFSPDAVQVNLATNVNTGSDAEGDILVNIENVAGSDFDDMLTGDDGDNLLEGRAGADTLIGGGNGELGDFADYSNSPGAVSINLFAGGGVGGDAAGDILFEIENLIGSAAADTFYGDDNDNIIEGGDGADYIHGGGEGTRGDVASYVQSDEAVVVDLSLGTATGGHAAGDTLIEIEGLIGSTLGDQLTGSASSNYLNGYLGDDTLDGGAGADSMEGGFGSDTYVVDDSGDLTVETASAGGVDRVASSVTRALGAFIENLTLTGGGAVNGAGNSLNNVIFGNDAANILSGAGGNDNLRGQGGVDILRGGGGRDILTGGDGADDFDFNSVAEIGNRGTRDIIRDFVHGVDDIDLSTIDANGTVGGNAAFKFQAVAGAAFTGVRGQLHWYKINETGTARDKTIIEGDTNGDKVADFQIELTGLVNLTGGDFIL